MPFGWLRFFAGYALIRSTLGASPGIYKGGPPSDVSGILIAVITPICLWLRSRLERYADSALGPRSARAVQVHLEHCSECRSLVDRQVQLSSLVKSSVVQPVEPDWTGFWPGIQARLHRESPNPIRDPWWVPFWKPFWGHPRLTLGGAMAAILAVGLSLWPLPGREAPVAWAGPITVQDVGTPDPERTVMVYSTPDQGDQALTVIWLLPSAGATDES